MTTESMIIPGNAESRYEIYLKIMNTRDVLQFLAESIDDHYRNEENEFDIGVRQLLLDQVDRLDECMESEELGSWSLPPRPI